MTPDQPAAERTGVGDFRSALHALHLAAGRPSARSISRDLDREVSHTTIADLFSGRRIPSWAITQRVVVHLGGDEAEFRRLWVQAGEEFGPVAAGRVRAGPPAGRLLREVTDPFGLEVHRPTQADGRQPERPTLQAYLPRDHDRRLTEVARAAAEGASQIAVLLGGPSTGKTRACWEALALLREQPETWRLWHPIDPARPEAALRELPSVGPRTVIWLNEAQFYLDVPTGGLGERVAAGLRELLRDPGRAPVLVLATLWPQFWERLTTRPPAGTDDLHAQARELLSGREITVPGTVTTDQPELATATGAPLPHIAQLPADIADFTGRTGEVRHLCDMLAQRNAASGPGAVRLAVVAGAAGLGKTTLAVHAAHQVRDLFPDGQLYVDLAGASARPVPSGEALDRFLRDLGIDGGKIPADDDQRAALYRSRLTGRRMLIVLDNARNAAQVRPLLPGTASCAVLVTTRNGALALASTQVVDLNTLSDSEALELFIRLVGDGRPADEPDETAEVLLACAGLPLAIRICAARLAARRQWKVATLASRLRDSRRRLDELQAGDLEVRASFQVSYDALGTARYRVDPARVFRLLGLWQGRTISLPAAAALTGEREADAADALERLVDANLLESPAPDRYRFHDLLRVYATERAMEEESEADRSAAVERLLHWYLATAEAAAGICSPHRYRIAFDAPADVEPPDFGGVADALEWYDGERDNVVAATRQASTAGLDDVGWRLPTALFPVYNRRSNWADCKTMSRIALDCVRRAGNRQGEGWVENNLGTALAWMREDEGIGHLESALAIRREISDGEGEAQAALNLAEAYHLLAGPRIALPHMLDSLDVVRRVGQASDHAHVLNNLGEVYLGLGRLEEAAECFQQVMDVLRDTSEPHVEGHVMHNLGRVYLGQGRPDEADGIIRRAIAIHRSTGDQAGEAAALRFLGHAQHGLGRFADARHSWTLALRILGQLDEPEHAREIETELASLAAGKSPGR